MDMFTYDTKIFRLVNKLYYICTLYNQTTITMKAIKEQIKKESAKKNPDFYVLENLNRILENGMITFNEWKDSGRFMNVNTFMELNPKEKLHKDCIDVVHYFGGLYIQALKTNKFYVEPKTYGKSLDVMEELVWKERAEKLFKKT